MWNAPFIGSKVCSASMFQEMPDEGGCGKQQSHRESVAISTPYQVRMKSQRLAQVVEKLRIER